MSTRRNYVYAALLCAFSGLCGLVASTLVLAVFAVSSSLRGKKEYAQIFALALVDAIHSLFYLCIGSYRVYAVR